MNRRERRRLERLQKKERHIAFAELDRIEREKREKKKRDAELVEEQLLAELENRPANSSTTTKPKGKAWWRKKHIPSY